MVFFHLVQLFTATYIPLFSSFSLILHFPRLRLVFGLENIGSWDNCLMGHTGYGGGFNGDEKEKVGSRKSEPRMIGCGKTIT